MANVYKPHSWEDPAKAHNHQNDWLNQDSRTKHTCTVCGVSYTDARIRTDMWKEQHTYTDTLGKTITSRIKLGCPVFLGDANGKIMENQERLRGVDGRLNQTDQSIESLDDRLSRLEQDNERLRSGLSAVLALAEAVKTLAAAAQVPQIEKIDDLIIEMREIETKSGQAVYVPVGEE